MNARIVMDRQVRNPVDEKIFGNFIEHIENCIQGGIYDAGHPLSDESGVRQDVLARCRELNPPILRFPGGTVMGIYHWQDHVGPVGERKKMRNIVWGGMLCHEFGTAEFVRFCRDIGAEPMICVNMPTGSAEEAAHWVEYCNGTEDSYYANLRRSHGYADPFNVKYWCIGNESYAEPDLGIQHDVNIYIRDAWEFTKYMKMTDPSIRMVYVGYDEAWNRAVLDSLYTMCDYLSIHHYSQQTEYERIGRFEKDVLEGVERLLDEYNPRPLSYSVWHRIPPRQGDIRIALDEWNLWNPMPDERSKYGVIQDYTWKDALWVAKFVNMMLRHSRHIGIGNMAQMVNVIAPIMAQKDGCYAQTTFYPMKHFRRECGDRLIGAQCDCAELDVCATLRGDGTAVAFAVNTSGETMEADFGEKIASATLLTSEDLMAVNDLNHDWVQVEDVAPEGSRVALPANSIAVIRIKP